MSSPVSPTTQKAYLQRVSGGVKARHCNKLKLAHRLKVSECTCNYLNLDLVRDQIAIGSRTPRGKMHPR